MKFLLKFTIFLSLTLSSFASDSLESKYNSIDISIATSFGDVEYTGTTASVTYKPEPVPFLLAYSYSFLDLDEVLGAQLFGVEANSHQLSLGFVIESDENFNIIPYIQAGPLEYSYLGYKIDMDATTFGVKCRATAGENSILNVGIAYSSLDSATISTAARTAINDLLAANGYLTLDANDFESLEGEFSDDTLVFDISMEYHYDENVSLTYGFATDFDSTALSFGVGFDY